MRTSLNEPTFGYAVGLRSFSYAAFIAAAMLIEISIFNSAIGSTPIALSNNPQLFLDDSIIAHTENVCLDVKQPKKHPSNPLIRADQPWERREIELYGTVLFDNDTQSFRCWYLASASGAFKPEYYICYAESQDGIHWKKPMVGVDPFGPYKRHNVVIRGGHGISVIKEPNDPNPDRRYKAVGGDLAAWSADGIHWTSENIRYAVGKNDTCPSMLRWKGQYLYFLRNQEPETGTRFVDDDTGTNWSGTMRGVGLSTSSDFREWTKKISILRSDERDGFPWGQPHALCVTAYGDVLIGLLPMLHLIPAEDNNFMGTMDVQLVTSRNGRDWRRVADRAIFMPCDKPQPSFNRKWDSRFHPGSNMFVKDDVVYIYYFGTNVGFGDTKWQEGSSRFGSAPPARFKELVYSKPRPFGIGLATLPADRFVSLRPVNWLAESVVRTRPVLLSGKDLIINTDASPENLRVALLDSEAQPIAGFEAEHSVAIPHDALRHRIIWRDGDTEKTLHDAPHRLSTVIEFRFRDGELYAFQQL